MFKPTLACNAEMDKLAFPLLASPKLDGIRCSIVHGKALTRTLKAVPNRFVSNLLSKVELGGLDGELIVGHPNAHDVYIRTTSGIMGHDGEPDFTYFVFDLHNREAGYELRYQQLHNEFAGRYPWIKVLPQAVVRDHDELARYEADVVADGYEGVILRGPRAPYKYGRSTVREGYLLKVKRFDDSEAMIVGFEEEMFNGNEAQTNELGRTKRSSAKAGLVGKGTLGAFVVCDVDSGIEFSIGTGLTAEQRKEFWARRDKLKGALVKYKFFAVGVKVAPRHPVFLGFRNPIDR